MSPETLRNDVMLANPTLNDRTIFSTIFIPATGYIDVIQVDSDYPDCA